MHPGVRRIGVERLGRAERRARGVHSGGRRELASAGVAAHGVGGELVAGGCVL